MNTKKQPTGRQKQKPEKNSAGTMKFFYLLMLVLIASSSVISIAGARGRASHAAETPTAESNPASGVGTAARVFVFHRGGLGSGTCDDLTITAKGNAVYSNCGNGVERQYSLSETELAQLSSWIGQFRAVNYDHTDKTRAGNVTTQLYLNGQGGQQAGEADTQKMIDFGITLAAEIASQP